MPSQSRPSRARAGAEDAADTSLERKTLLSLPPEILAHVVSFMGRTLSSPRPQPGALFRTCRDLYAVGTDTTTRIEFLLGTYGTESAVERVGTWLSLATREVLEGLFRRVGKVPRYQLQRLARRCVNASRSDLLLPIMAYGEEMYPAPSLRTVSLLGKPHAPPAGLGLSLTLTDEELFRIMANEDKVPGEVSYLVDEAVEGGWRVEGDSVMSAMLTLQKRYGFNPNFWLGVRVPLGQSGDNELRYSDRRTAHIFASDYGLEGVNGGHALLVTAIAANREPTVRRLLQLGVSTQGTSKDCFFWQAMEELCASLPLPSETEAEPSGYRSYGYADFDRGASKLISEYLGTPQVPDRYSYYSQYDGPLTTRPSKGAIIGALCRQFSSTSPYSEHSLFSDKARGDCTDALQVAIGRSAITANNDDRILRLLLRHLAESGWVGTEEGLKSLETCQAMCLKTDKLNFLNILQQYARENSGGGVVDGLVSALSAQDAVLAQQLVAEGMTMTDAQLGSVLRSRNLPVAHTFLVESYPWTEDRLKAVLANLLKSAIYNDRERVFELANRVITGQASRFSDGTGRSLLLTWFEDPNLEYFKRLIRPLLGPLSKKSGANGAALLAYDLKEALASNNVATIKSLCKLGAKVNPHQFMELVERYNGNSQDTLHALLEAQKFTAEELGRILKGCIRRHGDFVDYLLDPARSVKPHIDYNVVRECMISKSMKLHVVYTKILKAAAEQPAIIDKANQARRMALNRGGVWETAWMEYEAVYDESDGEDDDDEDEDDE